LLNPDRRDADVPSMSASRPNLRDARGFTLVEVMVAAMILVVGVLGVLTMLDGANRATARTKAREAGINLAREAIEAARAVPYPELIPAAIGPELQAQPGLADAGPEAGWQVRRRNIVYTITADVCSVDDGSLDAYGNHVGGFFCADSATTGTADTNPDDYKRVAVDIAWADGAQTRTARQEAVINNPGSAFAPAIKTLAPSSPSTATTISDPGTLAITFTGTTTSRPVGVKWFVDNVARGDATLSGAAGTTFTFAWDISTVEDGVYLLGAEAFDRYGQSGAERTVTMKLNRSAPDSPSNLTGGRNPLFAGSAGDIVELEWSPNPERDVVGYRVFRQGQTEPVCTTNVEEADHTRCVDDTAPATGSLTYDVYALAPARVGTGLEQSDAPASLVVGTPSRPDPPTVTGAVRDPAAGTTITWTAPADADIRYYRLYRDGEGLADRVDRTADGTGTSVIDLDGATSCHRYWITAVDEDLAESEPAPPGGIAPC